MRIAIVCQYYYPEIGAPAARMRSLARGLVELGHEVVVVTGFPNHPTGVIPELYIGKWWARERMDGIIVLRNWIYATPNEGFFKRILNHLSFMLSAVALGGPRLGRIDILIVSSPAFFAAPAAWLLSVVKGVPFVFEVRDLWPAIFVELGILKNRSLIRLLEAVEMFLYRRSAAVVTVTESFREILARRGVPESKIKVITNGVDISEFEPGNPDPALRGELGLKNEFVVLYLGTHGISHALRTVLEAARELGGERRISFLFVGEGAEKRDLMETARRWGLSNVRFMDGQPRERVLLFYRLADICLVPLRNIDSFSAFIPSKIFEIMACGKPIVASLRGEAARILEASGGAVLVEPEDSRAMAQAILNLESDADKRARMARQGRLFVEKYYDSRLLWKRYADLLTSARTRR